MLRGTNRWCIPGRGQTTFCTFGVIHGRRGSKHDFAPPKWLSLYCWYLSHCIFFVTNIICIVHSWFQILLCVTNGISQLMLTQHYNQKDQVAGLKRLWRWSAFKSECIIKGIGHSSLSSKLDRFISMLEDCTAHLDVCHLRHRGGRGLP